jgi:hypothetical protein
MMASGENRLSPTTMRRMPVLAQSQTSDATILNPPSLLGTGYSQTLQVQLNPGNNQLMLTATNLDAGAGALLLYALSGAPTVNLSYQLSVGAADGPVAFDPQTYSVDLAPASVTISPPNSIVGPLSVSPVPGQSSSIVFGYFQGAGAATITLTQTGVATVGVVFNANSVPSP